MQASIAAGSSPAAVDSPANGVVFPPAGIASAGDSIAGGSAFRRARRSIDSMVGSRSTIAITAVVSGLLGAFAWFGRAGAAGAGGGTHMVYLRGPGDPDCGGELERARARGDAGGLFLTEFKCKVHTGWTCPATCKGDELLVTHVAVKVQRDGQVAAPQVVRRSEARDYDDMSVNAVKAGAPFRAPPAPLLDGSGATPLKIEFVCDCAERPRPKK
jgi:hypothetical protein